MVDKIVLGSTITLDLIYSMQFVRRCSLLLKFYRSCSTVHRCSTDNQFFKLFDLVPFCDCLNFLFRTHGLFSLIYSQYVAKGSSSPCFSLFISFTFYFYISIFLIVSSSDVKLILNDDNLFNEAASEAFPLYNKSHFIVLSMSDRSGDVTNFLSISRVSYFVN
jgi:hypothetical protein